MSNNNKKIKKVSSSNQKNKEDDYVVTNQKKVYNEEEIEKYIKENKDPNSIVKAFIVSIDEDSESKQLKDEFAEKDLYDDAIRPPYDPSEWALFLEKSSILKGSVDAVALNTVGLGYEIIKNKVIGRSFTSAEEKKYLKEKEKLEELFDSPNPKMPFVTVMTRIKTDEEATGNGYMEVARNRSGKIAALYHIPAHTLRVRENGGFIQIRDQKIRYFKDFGDSRQISSETGEESKKKLKPQEKANEVIHFSLYCPRDSYYGAPKHVSAENAIEGNSDASEYNASFFKNSATPRYVVLCNGTNIDPNTVETGKKFFRADAKGPKKAHRCLVLQTQKRAFTSVSQGEIKLEAVSVGKTDDASFLEYQKKNDEELSNVHRIPPVLLGSFENVNRASALTAISIVNQQVFLPEQRRYEYIMNYTIVKDFGYKYAKFAFVDLESTDPVEKATIDETYAGIAGLSIDDIRQSIKREPYNKEWSKVPWEVVKTFMQLQQTMEQNDENIEKMLNNVKGSDKKILKDLILMQKKFKNSFSKIYSSLSDELKDFENKI